MLDKKIKILYGLEAASGGALKHLVYLATHLDKDLFDVTIILSPRSAEANSEISKLRTAGITVVQLPMPREISFFRDLTILLKIIKYTSKNNFDIVHAHSSKAGFYFRIAAFISRVPLIIYTPHCFFFQSKVGVKRKIFELIEGVLGTLTHKLIVSENEMKQCSMAGIVSSSKLNNINNAIKFEEYIEHERHLNLSSFGVSEDAVVIGAVSRLVDQKDLLTLVLAAKKLTKRHSNLYFIIAGSGELENFLKSEVVKYDLCDKVLLVGYQYEIGRVFSAIDIFVNTSLWEGLPYVILEAMWYKKPIVATNLGYGSLLDDPQNAYFIPPGDVNLLCEKLEILINDKRLCEDIGSRNHSKVKSNYAFDEFVRLHELLYLTSY